LSAQVLRGTIGPMNSRSAAEQHLRELARLRRVRDRIDREYAQPLNVETLACGVHMSAGHLSRQFKLAFGESPYSYLMTRRIERAMAMLRRGDLSVTEVCFAVGCARRWVPSARVSPSWPAYRPASIGARRRAQRRACHPAWQDR
jgi:AraC-like DNA-binding protein